MLDRVKDWIWGPPFGRRAATRVDLVLALVLSAFAEVLVIAVAALLLPAGWPLGVSSDLASAGARLRGQALVRWPETG